MTDREKQVAEAVKMLMPVSATSRSCDQYRRELRRQRRGNRRLPDQSRIEADLKRDALRNPEFRRRYGTPIMFGLLWIIAQPFIPIIEEALKQAALKLLDRLKELVNDWELSGQ